jgi:hypothetical protein
VRLLILSALNSTRPIEAGFFMSGTKAKVNHEQQQLALFAAEPKTHIDPATAGQGRSPLCWRPIWDRMGPTTAAYSTDKATMAIEATQRGRSSCQEIRRNAPTRSNA